MRHALRLVPVVLLSLTSLVFAEAITGTDQAPPDQGWLSQAAALLLFGFIIAVNIKPSKREHRD